MNIYVKQVYTYQNSLMKRLFTDTVSVNKMHLTDIESVNKKHLTDAVSVNEMGGGKGNFPPASVGSCAGGANKKRARSAQRVLGRWHDRRMVPLRPGNV
jgi:hypothetical protein